MLITLFVGALFSFQTYIQRGVQGQYRKAGESFGSLRQYNPGASIDCAFDPATGKWYAQACYNNKILKDGCTKMNAGAFDMCVANVKANCVTGCKTQ